MMITKLKIKNFKSHRNTELNLGNLTLLSGLNSSGKSSAIQVFLLLRQSFKKGRLEKGLDLNEPLCDIGKGEDALYRFADSDIISFEIEKNDGSKVAFQFDTRDRYDDSFLPATGKSVINEDLVFFTNQFQYLSAERVANVEFYPLDSYAVEVEKQISQNYGQGELVAHFLEYYGQNRNFSVQIDGILHPTTKSRKLLDQVVSWEQEISPRVTLNTQRIADKIILDFGYLAEGSVTPLKNIKSKNVGFGLSYSLSIVVAVLSASPGSLLLIENPEAHLHPMGQSKMAELFCLAAENGVQLIIETHSDHIFNGIRKSVYNRRIKRENVKVHYFNLDESNTTKSTEIALTDRGRIENPTEGLFDQFDNDLDELIGL